MLGALSEVLAGYGLTRLVGVDEVGRGPLAGPVVAAAVMLPPTRCRDGAFAGLGIDDSKKLSPARREYIFARLASDSRIAIGLGAVSPAGIDRLNILEAARLAMLRAVAVLNRDFDLVVVDGNRPLPLSLPQYPLIKGDSRALPVAAASIVAKVVRDRQMFYYDRRWPEYGFAAHKGYGTALHRQALQRHGPCPIHRMSFKLKSEK